MPQLYTKLFPERYHASIARFLALPEFDRNVACLIAMNGSACTPEHILEHIRTLGIISSEKGASSKVSKQIYATFRTLEGLGWLVTTYNRQRIAVQERVPMLLWLCSESDKDVEMFSRLADARRNYIEAVTARTRIWRFAHEVVLPGLTPLQELYYAGQYSQPPVKQTGSYRIVDTSARELLDVVGRPFDIGRIRHLPENKYDLAMGAGIEALWTAGYPIRPYVDMAAASSDGPLNSLAQFVLAAESLILSGRFESAEALANRHAGIADQFFVQAVEQVHGWIAFIRGDDDTAIARFEAAMEWSIKGTRKRKTFPTGHSGMFFMMALLRRARGDDHANLEKYAKWGLEMTGQQNFTGSVLLMLLMSVEFLNGIGSAANFKRTHEIHMRSRDGFSRSPLFLISALVVRWTGIVTSCTEESKSELEAFASEVSSNGFTWIASVAYELLEANGAGDVYELNAYRKKAEALRDQCEGKLVSMVNLIRAPEPWERSLGALEKLADITGGKSSASGNGKRLLWLVTADYSGSIGVVPYIQTPLKSGKLGVPRRTSIERLLATEKDQPSLTVADRRAIEVLNAAPAAPARYAFSNAFGVEHRAALEALVGSSSVYADEFFYKPVELVAQSPEISLTTTKAGELKLALRPALDYREPGIVVKMESENRVTITTVRQSHVDLHRVLQMGSSFPVEAKERLVASLGKLSSEVSIESDSVGFETIARSVPAQDLPELRLMPDGEGGIMVSLSVQPIVEVGEHFAPGSGKPVVFARTQENEHLQTERNLKVEAERASAVALACAVLQGGREETRNAWTWHLAEPDDCLELLLDLNELNADTVKVTWPEGESLRPPKAVSASQFRGSVKGAGQWFEADGELQVDDDLVLTMRQLMELLELSNAGSRFIEISKGRFIALTRQFRRQLDDLRALSTEGKGGVRKLSPLAAHALADLEETTSLKTGTGWKSQLKKIRDAEDFQPKVPKTLRADLRGYQTDGYDWLARLAEWGAGACLADDMGLGKTVQALALLLHRAKGGPALVIAPTSVAANWIDEVARFAPTLEIVLYTGPDRKDRLEEIGSHSLVITTYGILQRGDDELTAVKWHTVVLDEAQAIKNRATKRSKAAMKLQAPFRIATTGTPVENRLDELHNLFTFLNPGLLGSAERFRTQFADPIERNKDAAARDRLRRVIKPFILRRMKGDVLKDLPPKTEVTLHVELDEQESAFYEALRQKAVSDLESAKQAPEESAVRILAEITRLRRACCHPKLVQPKGAPESSKQRVFIETLTEILDGGHQVLVFSQFVDHLKIARQSLDDLGIEYQYLDGSTPARKRKVAIDAFQSGEGNVFLISLKAGGSGLNLTAADYVIHLDPWWNPAVEDQASDRAHRIGQQRPVTVYRLVTKGTIEEKIVALHHEKRDLASAMLEGTDAAGRLTSEQMLALIRDAGA